MQLRKIVENRMFPHFLATFLWIFLVISLAFNLNFSIAVTGAVANGGLKVIMLFHLLMLFFPVSVCTIFYGMSKEGIAERCIIGLSMLTILFSVANISLHFVNDAILFMKATELVAWGLYNSIFSVSIYKILVVLLLPVLKRFVKIEEEPLRSDKRLLA